jgi:hypothetical protein
MRAKLSVVVSCVAALSVGVAAAAGAPSSAVGCNAGPTTIGGKNAMVFCGPAKASVTVAGKTYKLSGGTCTRTSKYFYVNLGTEIFGVAKQKQPYFGVLIGQYPGANPGTPSAPKDGTYGGGLVTVRYKGKAWDLNGFDKDVKVTLKKNRTVGTFTGSTHFTPRVKVTGSFSC